MATIMQNGGPGPSTAMQRETMEKVMARLEREFPDQESLSRHRDIQQRLHVEIRDIKQEIASLVAQLKRDQDPTKMGRIQAQIGDLMLQINVIREKAAEAEAIVKSITTDVQRLDVAERNLTSSIQTLERWDMLQQAHRQLQDVLQARRYRGISQALAAVLQLLGPLKYLSNLPDVGKLFQQAEQDRKTAQEMVAGEMDVYFRQDPNRPPDLDTIREVCLVIDVLGGDFKTHMIERYLQLQLAEYRRIFRSTDEAGQLDNVPRRYAWFRRLMKDHEEEDADLFPESWELTRLLVANFSEYTRADLLNLLGKQTPQIGLLLEALQATLDFEGAMEKRFEKPFDEITAGSGMLQQAGAGKWTISAIFDGYFGVYVDAQDRAISDMLSAYRGNRSRPSLEGVMANEAEGVGPTVLPSSTELFYFYGQTLDQCAKYTNGEAMAKLSKVFGKYLKVYCDDVLKPGLKKLEVGPAVGRRSLEGRANMQEVRTACMILNTAEYCQNTSLQLEERVKGKIADNLQDAVTYQDERDTFSTVISFAIATILRELEVGCEPAFAAILRTPWRDLENVSGRSAYVVDLVGSIKQVAEVVREKVEGKRFIRNFSDKAVGVVMSRFTQAVIKSRPLRKIGAEQILLDVQAIKSCLLDLPEPHPEHSTNTYVKYVTKNTGQLETMLKVILAPDDPPEGFVQNYCLLIGDRAFTNFQKILDLKGTPRNDQQKLLDIFLSVTSTNDELSDTSFLTALDMDPPADKLVTSPSSANLFSPTSGHAALAGAQQSLLRSGSADGGTFGLPGLSMGMGLGGSLSQDGERSKPFGEFRRFVSFATRRD